MFVTIRKGGPVIDNTSTLDMKKMLMGESSSSGACTNMRKKGHHIRKGQPGNAGQGQGPVCGDNELQTPEDNTGSSTVEGPATGCWRGNTAIGNNTLNATLRRTPSACLQRRSSWKWTSAVYLLLIFQRAVSAQQPTSLMPVSFEQCRLFLAISDLDHNSGMDRDPEYIRYLNFWTSDTFGNTPFNDLDPSLILNFENYAGVNGEINVEYSEPGITAPIQEIAFFLDFCENTKASLQVALGITPSSPIQTSSPQPYSQPPEPYQRISFIECRIYMAMADQDRDSSLDGEEYIGFVDRILSTSFAYTAFADPDISAKILTHLPDTFNRLATNGQISIEGARPGQALTSDQEMFLQQVCIDSENAVIEAVGFPLSTLRPTTSANNAPVPVLQPETSSPVTGSPLTGPVGWPITAPTGTIIPNTPSLPTGISIPITTIIPTLGPTAPTGGGIPTLTSVPTDTPKDTNETVMASEPSPVPTASPVAPVVSVAPVTAGDKLMINSSFSLFNTAGINAQSLEDPSSRNRAALTLAYDNMVHIIVRAAPEKSLSIDIVAWNTTSLAGESGDFATTAEGGVDLIEVDAGEVAREVGRGTANGAIEELERRGEGKETQEAVLEGAEHGSVWNEPEKAKTLERDAVVVSDMPQSLFVHEARRGGEDNHRKGQLRQQKSRRKLQVSLVDGSPVLYSFVDSACPTDDIPEGASCQTAFAGYEVAVTGGEKTQMLYQRLVTNTQNAIEEGDLQKQLQMVDPISPLTISGASYPVTSREIAPANTGAPMPTAAPTDASTGLADQQLFIPILAGIGAGLLLALLVACVCGLIAGVHNSREKRQTAPYEETKLPLKGSSPPAKVYSQEQETGIDDAPDAEIGKFEVTEAPPDRTTLTNSPEIGKFDLTDAPPDSPALTPSAESGNFEVIESPPDKVALTPSPNEALKVPQPPPSPSQYTNQVVPPQYANQAQPEVSHQVPASPTPSPSSSSLSSQQNSLYPPPPPPPQPDAFPPSRPTQENPTPPLPPQQDALPQSTQENKPPSKPKPAGEAAKGSRRFFPFSRSSKTPLDPTPPQQSSDPRLKNSVPGRGTEDKSAETVSEVKAGAQKKKFDTTEAGSKVEELSSQQSSVYPPPPVLPHRPPQKNSPTPQRLQTDALLPRPTQENKLPSTPKTAGAAAKGRRRFFPFLGSSKNPPDPTPPAQSSNPTGKDESVKVTSDVSSQKKKKFDTIVDDEGDASATVEVSLVER
jgi:hypothetical protein